MCRSAANGGRRCNRNHAVHRAAQAKYAAKRQAQFRDAVSWTQDKDADQITARLSEIAQTRGHAAERQALKAALNADPSAREGSAAGVDQPKPESVQASTDQVEPVDARGLARSADVPEAVQPEPAKPARKPTARQVSAATRALATAESKLKQVSMGKTNPENVAHWTAKRDAAAAKLAALTGTAPDVADYAPSADPTASEGSAVGADVPDTDEPAGGSIAVEPEQGERETVDTAQESASEGSAEGVEPEKETTEQVEAEKETTEQVESETVGQSYEQQTTDAIAAQRERGLTDAQIAAQIREVIAADLSHDRVPAFEAALATLTPATAKPKRKPAAKKAAAPKPPANRIMELMAEHDGDMDAVDAAIKAEVAERQAAVRAHQEAFAALTPEEQARIIAQQDADIERQIAANRAAQQKRDAERRAAMTPEQRAAEDAKKAADDAIWQAYLARQAANPPAPREQDEDTWYADQPDPMLAVPNTVQVQPAPVQPPANPFDVLTPVNQQVQPQVPQGNPWDALRAQAQAAQPVQSPADPLAALRVQAQQQATARDAAIRQATAQAQPLSTPELRAEAEKWDADRLAEAEGHIARIATERLVADAQERAAAEAYAQTPEGQSNPFAQAFAAQRPRKRPGRNRATDPDAPIPASGHRLPEGSLFGGRVYAKVEAP